MFGPIGMPELIIIFIIALIVFGPRKLPELGKSLGRSIAEFKRASNELRHTLEEEIRLEETKPKGLRDETAAASAAETEAAPTDENKPAPDEPAAEGGTAAASDEADEPDEPRRGPAG